MLFNYPSELTFYLKEKEIKVKNLGRRIILILVTIVFLSFTSSPQINFFELTIDDNVHGLGSIIISDLDNDLDMDVLGASLEDNQIIWWRNDGGDPIQWSKFIIGNNVISAHSVYVADFDGVLLHNIYIVN